MRELSNDPLEHPISAKFIVIVFSVAELTQPHLFSHNTVELLGPLSIVKLIDVLAVKVITSKATPEKALRFTTDFSVTPNQSPPA